MQLIDLRAASVLPILIASILLSVVLRYVIPADPPFFVYWIVGIISGALAMQSGISPIKKD